MSNIHVSVTQEERDTHERRLLKLRELGETLNVLREMTPRLDGSGGYADWRSREMVQNRCCALFEELFETSVKP